VRCLCPFRTGLLKIMKKFRIKNRIWIANTSKFCHCYLPPVLTLT
jgi:hypothetical protein